MRKYEYPWPMVILGKLMEIIAKNFLCGKNIKGLTKMEVQQIKNFKIKVDSLRNLLN